MINRARQFGVGLFVLTGILALSFMVFMVGKDKGFLSVSHQVYTTFKDIRGLRQGAAVHLAGIGVGHVQTITFTTTKEGQTVIRLTLSVIRKYFPMIREDSVAEIATKGVLGDKFVQITPGSADRKPVLPGGTVGSTEGRSIVEQLGGGGGIIDRVDQVLAGIDDIVNQLRSGEKVKTTVANVESITNQFDDVLKKLRSSKSALGQMLAEDRRSSMNRTLRSLEKTSTHLASILGKIDRGEGTLGAMINDPTLFEDIKILMGGAKRNALLKFMVREALRRSESRR